VSEIHKLKALNLRKVWPDEARNFTPWLAQNLDLLASRLNLILELVGVEVTLPRAGRVDILAEQATTRARVVIENQLGSSDHSHCLRLLGYAANAEANILVWVAGDFTDYHKSILSWLNESDNIAVYAVALRAFRVGSNVAADFEVVIEPSQSQPGTSAPSRKTASSYYAEFYRPVVANLRRSGLLPVGRGGFRGRYRSFQTGYANVFYSSGFFEGRATASLGMYGSDKQHIFQSLSQHRTEIDAQLHGRPEWHQEEGQCWMWLTSEAAVEDPMSIPEEIGQWITENLLRLREVVQPYLERVMVDESTSMDHDEYSE